MTRCSHDGSGTGRILDTSSTRWLAPRTRAALALWIWLCAAALGCSRWQYVERADQNAYSILDLHSQINDWSAPTDLSVVPTPESRLFDPTPIAVPTLPDPTPHLHSYVLPPGIGRSPNAAETLPEPALRSPAVAPVSYDRRQPFGEVSMSSTSPGDQRDARRVLLARLRAQDAVHEEEGELDVSPVTVPRSAWESIPPECRMRMFEFESVRREYEKSFGTLPPVAERDGSPQLAFEDILHLALLNSREYQAQKEQLYRVALRLSLEEYDYQLKFAPFGNRIGARYESRGSSLESLSRLDVPSSAQVQALLGTGTNLVTRFANNVLMTFNGPDGFAADIGSELLFELTHSVFQKDIRFERLTQAERNVVYAARNFARFRRTFYTQLAAQYYNLLRTYRQVEIDTQNYVSLVRVYSQREVEFSEGEVARVQIDQVEQNALTTRSSLIGTCTNLENALDQLKLLMGLPTETLINLELGELESLTLGDEALVKLELVRRIEARLVAELARQDHDEANALNLAVDLVTRMQEAIRLRQEVHSSPTERPAPEGTAETIPMPNPEELHQTEDQLRNLGLVQLWLQVAELRALSDRTGIRLQEARADAEAPAFRVIEVSVEFANSIVDLLSEERNLATSLGSTAEEVAAIERRRANLVAEVAAYESFLEEILGGLQLQQLDELRRRADSLVETAVQAVNEARSLNAARMHGLGLTFEQSPQATLLQLLDQAKRLLAGSGSSLPAINLDMDSAAFAALARRWDLANARGTLFDEWRGTKLASDDLKSILDLQARQRLITQNEVSQPFEVDFDESRTELSVTIDTPLNRRFQRNAFREQLLNYQLSRRSVMALEDAIKQDIRSDLRTIRLARDQHGLGIASAALAYERVISTELQLRLGVPGVFARDYLEAQTAYANSLSVVAARHISYITGRITLFADLEQLQLDPVGNWPGLHDPAWNPEGGIEEGLWNGYGGLPWGIHYSKELNERSQQYWSMESNFESTDEDADDAEVH